MFKKLTHCNPEDFRVVRFVVVLVKGRLPNSECSFYCLRIICVECCRCKMLVNVIHSGNYGGNAGSAAREEESRIFKNLYKRTHFVSEEKEIDKKNYPP
jgi:hypothetical protein